MNRIQVFIATAFTLLSGVGAALLPEYSAVAHTAGVPAVADENGDYSKRSDQVHWQVVDPDENGLNCRMAGTLEDIHRDSFSNIDPPNILDFPVVATLEWGEYFDSQLNTGGWVAYGDDRGLPWVYVQGLECFVRANSRFIVPASH